MPRRTASDAAEDKRLDRAAAFYQHVVEPAHPIETQFRHSHWKARRDRVRQVMEWAGAGALKLNRWDECGGGCVAEYSPSQKKWRLRADYCHDRHCEPCMRAKANKIAANLRNRLGQRPDGKYRFITIALRHSNTPLRDQIRRLYKCFKTLRSSKVWKRTQRGGAAVLEVKWQPHSREWHPHLHIIAEGDFIPQKQLSEAWLHATRDSFIVDVRPLSDADAAVFYVTKYITKGTSSDVWRDDQAALEFVTSLGGVRTSLTYGTWRGFKLLEKRRDVDDWKPVATLVNIVTAAKNGEEWAKGALLQLRPPGATDTDTS